MNYKVSFQEMQKLAMEKLSRQSPATFDEKKQQVLNLKSQRTSDKKKSKS
jgi:hypothetical protein